MIQVSIQPQVYQILHDAYTIMIISIITIRAFCTLSGENWTNVIWNLAKAKVTNISIYIKEYGFSEFLYGVSRDKKYNVSDVNRHRMLRLMCFLFIDRIVSRLVLIIFILVHMVVQVDGSTDTCAVVTRGRKFCDSLYM